MIDSKIEVIRCKYCAYGEFKYHLDGDDFKEFIWCNRHKTEQLLNMCELNHYCGYGIKK